MPESNTHNEFIEKIKKKAAEILPAGSKLSLYGSRARGDAKPDSDWDFQILISGEEKLPLSFWDIYAWPLQAIGFENDEMVDIRIYSYSGWFKRKFLPFYKNLERDAITIYSN